MITTYYLLMPDNEVVNSNVTRLLRYQIALKLALLNPQEVKVYRFHFHLNPLS